MKITLEEEIKTVAEDLADKASNVKHSVLWDEVKRHSETAIKAWVGKVGFCRMGTQELEASSPKCKDKQRGKDDPCKYPVGSCELCKQANT